MGRRKIYVSIMAGAFAVALPLAAAFAMGDGNGGGGSNGANASKNVVAPDDSAASSDYLAARQAMARADFETAESLFKKVLEQTPDHVGANKDLGVLYLALKQPDRAEQRLAVLHQVCGDCQAYGELKVEIERFKANPG